MTGRSSKQARARAALDPRLDAWRQLSALGARPHGGWVRAIRDALGMPASDLAARMGITQSTVARIEASERAGRIQVDTLQRAADALGCDLVYALVPRRSLDELVDERARQRARAQLGALGHTMALEDQALDDTQARSKQDFLVEHYKTSPGLWQLDRNQDR